MPVLPRGGHRLFHPSERAAFLSSGRSGPISATLHVHMANAGPPTPAYLHLNAEGGHPVRMTAFGMIENVAAIQLQPEVLPQPSHTWHDPAGRILVPQVKQSGLSIADPLSCSSNSAVV